MTNTDTRRRAQPIRLPLLQHASLQAMGIELPWIVAESSTPTESSETSAAQITPSAERTERAMPSAPDSGDVQALVEAARQAVKTVRQPRTGDDRSAAADSSHQAIRFAQARIPEALKDVDAATLAQHVAQCKACVLSGSRHQAVVGEGPLNARVLVVSEAPGEQEDLQGQPFVGAAGELFDNMLAAIGCRRDTDVYVTNMIKCRPVGNRSPRPDEIASCLPYLKRQVELLNPKVVLVMGRLAALTLVEEASPQQTMYQLRKMNPQLECGERSIPIIVTFHPSYLMRRAQDKRLAWDDLKRLAALL